MEKPPLFDSIEDECRYWKERANFYYKEWSDTKQEFDEYAEDSRQLEAEMETTLKQRENVVRECRKQILLHEKECEALRIKLESVAMEFKNVEKQLLSTRNERDSLKKYLRQLEQKNDDLERSYRILTESIAGVKTDLDKAYEKNALLEIEMDEKEILQEKLQRLMDETRDLKQELHVKEKLPAAIRSGLTDVIQIDEANGKCDDLQTCQIGASQRSTKHHDHVMNGNALPASSRTTALNIVADMLRKLNAMESKLKDYREQVPGQRQ